MAPSEAAAPRDEAAHITGEYYWYDDASTRVWAAATVLSVVMPPVGIFLLSYLITDSITREESLSGSDAAGA